MYGNNGTDWNQALRGEPVLQDVLTDPIILALMARDGISRVEIERLALAYRGRRPGAMAPPPSAAA